MNKQEYLKNYKKFHYSKTRKIVTFPLLLEEFEVLEKRALKYEVSNNTMAKNIVLSTLTNTPLTQMSMEQKALLQDFMRISRGIANNINQLAYSGNIGEVIDVSLLITSLKHYEDEFKSVISKLEQ